MDNLNTHLAPLNAHLTAEFRAGANAALSGKWPADNPYMPTDADNIRRQGDWFQGFYSEFDGNKRRVHEAQGSEDARLSEQLTRAKNLLVRLYDKAGSGYDGTAIRQMIERGTGGWFVWGVDRDADRAARASALLPRDGGEAEITPLVESYVQPVPDKCDRIVWRGRYYHLPLDTRPNTPAAHVAATPSDGGMSDARLLPCPFCGWKASTYPRTCEKKTPYNPTDRSHPIARCNQCHATVQGEDWKDEETAARAWNRRAASTDSASSIRSDRQEAVPHEKAPVPASSPVGGVQDSQGDNARLPYDVSVGGVTFRKGVHLSTFVGAAQRWHQEAFPDYYTLTPEQKQANLDRLLAVAGGSDATQQAAHNSNENNELCEESAMQQAAPTDGASFPAAPQGEPVAIIRTWRKVGEFSLEPVQHAELIDWTDAIEGLTDGEHKLFAAPQGDGLLRQPPTVEQAHAMGADGAPALESERLLFEAWMRGHCWALSAQWNGREYLGSDEGGGGFNPLAMQTRRLWAAWRDCAALRAALPSTTKD